MERRSRYDATPFTAMGPASACDVGWPAILERLRPLRSRKRCVLAVECYPGVDVEAVRRALADGLLPVHVADLRQAYKDAAEIERMCGPYLGDDPQFGRMNGLTLGDYLEPGRTAVLRGRADAVREGLLLVVGAGASLLCRPDVVVYADLSRARIRERQRRGEVASLGVHDQKADYGRLAKRGFYVDWRAADRLKRLLLERADWLLDTNDATQPKLIGGDDLRRGLAKVASQPFRLVPAKDPGTPGGARIAEICGLPGPPAGRLFDCVPEETSLLLGFGATRVELPALDLVFRHARTLLGEAVHARFGVEFPIRFDFLDASGGAEMMPQLTPSTEYAQDRFGVALTQDGSYYMLATGGDARVCLGLRPATDQEALLRELRSAFEAGGRLSAEAYFGSWPAQRHDHFLIPAGTVHGLGRDCVALEVGSAPCWLALDLGGGERTGRESRARLAAYDHVVANLQWDRVPAWVEAEALNRVCPVAEGEGWREETTGLHARQFVETRRHWFTAPVSHDTRGGVNVLNLVEGDEALVESAGGTFEPFVVHENETLVVPACVGAYTVRPHGAAVGAPCATLKAFVRTQA